MEEKKFDSMSFIGMLLLGGIMLWWMNTKKPKVEPENKTKTEQVTTQNEIITPTYANDSIKKIAMQNKLGVFANSAISASEATTTIENDLVKLVVSNKGGQIVEAMLKKEQTHDSLPLYIVKNKNANFNINFGTTDNRTLNTKDLYFTPNKIGNVLSMKLKVSENQFLEYRYEVKPNDYRIAFTVRSQGLSNVINGSQEINLDWSLKSLQKEKSRKTEDMYTTLFYNEDGDVESMMQGDEDADEEVKWVAFKQHFFTTFLKSDTPFSEAKFTLDKSEETDKVYTKTFKFKAPLALKGGELNYNMELYYGTSDYNLLETYDDNLYEITDLGWGIFGFLNKWVFYPVFNGLKGFIGNYGLIIILMTIVVRIFLSPVLFRSYVSSAKMKIIRPELEEINKKYPGKENAMKRQQETMEVQRKAGVSVMSGCIPALIQMPIFFALFQFFPKNFDLRQKSFLWATDLSSYDVIFNLPFKIPLYGNHISLFPILASIAIFFYMKMSQSQQANMQAPPQEGMPDMTKMMKYMLYVSPIMMLFFFNNYASGLSLYYFVSNTLTIAIVFVIKNYVIDEDKIHAKIQENKSKPTKKSKFRQRLDNAMKQAQEQQELQRKNRKK
ncbi:MAG: membrane protein insertase YidC [Polaribacter sp.]|nr:MAG: membrane protein insertase YidC [Polaribacter sp.]